jgi:hypothetical protein
MPISYRFFFSYAREDRRNSVIGNPFNQSRGVNLIDALFEELRGEVQERLGCPPPETAYRDIKDIKAGHVWPVELAEAVCNSCVLIALLTPNYLRSQNCGREFAVFQLRFEKIAKPRFHHIVPIFWQSSAYCNPHIPERAREFFNDVQLFGGGLPERYPAAVGLKDIWRMGPQEDFHAIVISTADRIVSMINEQQLPPLAGFENFHHLPSAFALTEADATRAQRAAQPLDMSLPAHGIDVRPATLPLLNATPGLAP